jgi:hypothetical protein
LQSTFRVNKNILKEKVYQRNFELNLFYGNFVKYWVWYTGVPIGSTRISLWVPIWLWSNNAVPTRARQKTSWPTIYLFWNFSYIFIFILIYCKTNSVYNRSNLMRNSLDSGVITIASKLFNQISWSLQDWDTSLVVRKSLDLFILEPIRKSYLQTGKIYNLFLYIIYHNKSRLY